MLRFLVTDDEGYNYLTDGTSGRFHRVSIDGRPMKPARIEQVYELVPDKEPPYVMTPEFANYQKILMRDNLL